MAAIVAACAALSIPVLMAGSASAGKNSAHRHARMSATRSIVIRPFRIAHGHDWYWIPTLRGVVSLQLLGYRYRWLPVQAARRHLSGGVLRISRSGRGLRRLGARGRRSSVSGARRVIVTLRSPRRSPTSSCPVPYSSSSPWNRQIPARPRVDPNSASMIATLTTNTPYPKLGSDPTQYTMPVYTVSSSTAAVPVWVSGSWSDVVNPRTLRRHYGGTTVRVPVPARAQAASGGDAQLIVINRSTGDEWGFWELYNDGGRLTATNGYHYNTRWNGIPPPGFASRGAGVPYLAGLVRPCEIAHARIDHAIAFGYQNTTSRFVFPATKSDGGASAGMPEGTHLQLNPSISDSSIRGWGCTGACFTTAKALQKYGMYLIDTAGHPKLYFEYDGTAHWGTKVTASTPNDIPLSAFRVVDG